ncbi:hypothetical protein H5410_015829 [Solanum commersonii]|uniref:Uncharacterized protein n=1 Tax=Solanum commersonii TaxID=4109 RepID=A0A9J5ZUK0_SOLCO|nr:hypothetical protein H5410_015829 [Solanum commersonii]
MSSSSSSSSSSQLPLSQEIENPVHLISQFLPLKYLRLHYKEEEEEETPLVWHRKRVRGANVLTTTISDLEVVHVVLETKPEDKPAESKGK